MKSKRRIFPITFLLLLLVLPTGSADLIADSVQASMTEAYRDKDPQDPDDLEDPQEDFANLPDEIFADPDDTDDNSAEDQEAEEGSEDPTEDSASSEVQSEAQDDPSSLADTQDNSAPSAAETEDEGAVLPDEGESAQAPAEEAPPVELTDPDLLGNWTSYNEVIFEDATIYQSQSGGGLAVGGSVAVHNNFAVGSTYTAEYDPILHIGEYKNEDRNPALLLGGKTISAGDAVDVLAVQGGAITMSPELLEVNGSLPTGFAPGADSYYQSADQQLLDDWFAHQYQIAEASSELLQLGNDVTIDITELSDGSYMEDGPDRFRNQYFEINGEVHQNALFITVRSGSDLNLGQWWPVHSIICLDVNWAIDSDLIVLNFPDAVNVTMNSSAFQLLNMQHWSTTVDAWVGERGMEERLALAEKVVYNFPNARSIETNQALIQGTILAPDASFTGVGFGDSGHIFGHIVAKRYVAQGNFTIHAFTLTHWIYDIVEDALSKQTESGSISLRHYLYFNGEPTSIRAQGGEYLLENEEGHYFDGAGGFVGDRDSASVYTTNLEGYTQIRDVPLGDYTLVKTSAPDGFALNDTAPDNLYTYARFPVSVENPDQTVQAVRYSEPVLTDLYFRKVDAETGQPLAGAVFTIVREQDEYQDSTVGGTYVSDEDGKFVSQHLPLGVYHLVEIEPPSGYALLEGGEVSFAVVWDEAAGALAVQDPAGNPLQATAERPMEIPNSPGGAANTAMLIKYSEETDEPGTYYTLPGARFALYRYAEDADRWVQVTEDAMGEVIDLATNEYGYCRIDNLPDGVYRVVEVDAPPGYSLANRYMDEVYAEDFPNGYSYEFTFSEIVSFYTAYIPNRALETEITVVISGDLLGETQLLTGATLRLEHLLSDGKTWEELFHTSSTNTEGELLLPHLTAGTYRLTQLQAPRGFRPLDPAAVLFSISFDAQGNPVAEVFYGGNAVEENSHPVRLEHAGEMRILIHNETNMCDYMVYKIDADYTVGVGGDGEPIYEVTYLEGAQFRLRRRPSARTVWQDYGGMFASELLLDEHGGPVPDSYGNHIAAAVFEGGLLYGEYQLVELNPPDGYHPNSDVEVRFNDGEVGYQLHLFTVTESMASGEQTLTYNALNYADRGSTTFRFRLVDARNRADVLGGAEFALYHCDEDHVHDDLLTADSCWSKSTPIFSTSSADGTVSFDNLVSGDYLLIQDDAPAGYRILNALWMVTVDAGREQVDVELLRGAHKNAFIKKDENGEWLLPHWKNFALPMTGGGGTFVWTAGVSH